MSNEPDISVLMPAYNTEAYIEDAVISILAQSLASFEMIVIDDGSTDHTREILIELAQTDSRLIIHSRPNQGVVATRNELLSLAKAELIAWMDSDDICEPERLQMQAACFAQNQNLVSVGSSLLYMDPQGRPLSITTFPERLDIDQHLQSPRTDTPFGASMMRTQAVREVGGFRGPFRIGEDFDLMLRLIEVGEIWNLKEPLYRYRQHPYSISSPTQLGDDWPDHFSLIMNLAIERRKTGSDRLQRGERIGSISRTVQPPVEEVSAAIRHAKWARQAKLHGFIKSAIIHASIAIWCSPLSSIGWRALAHVLVRQAAT